MRRKREMIIGKRARQRKNEETDEVMEGGRVSEIPWKSVVEGVK